MKRICRRSILWGVILGFLFVSLWGCSSTKTAENKQDKKTPWWSSASESTAHPATQKTQTNVTYYIHTVKWSGESLSIIAGWYTGDIQNWKMLAEANPDMDPNVVAVGQKIRIPENVMTTRSPMTKAHVDKYYPKAEKQDKHKMRSTPSETKDEAPTLYGPK
jgi:hypothetical protein